VERDYGENKENICLLDVRLFYSNLVSQHYLSITYRSSKCQHIRKIQIEILWGKDSESRKIMWIKWDNISNQKRMEVRN